MKILIQSWRFGKVVWATTWEGAPETTISELKFAVCAALGKSRARLPTCPLRVGTTPLLAGKAVKY
jgi:hypothetical protein